jgi:hypothetical protein
VKAAILTQEIPFDNIRERVTRVRIETPGSSGIYQARFGTLVGLLYIESRDHGCDGNGELAA